MQNDLTAHMIVKNEEQWIWYAINSVLPYVSKMIIYDTGSQDKTVKIIRLIKNNKIDFTRKGTVTPHGLARLRNEQIKFTKTSWFLLLDGDEIWPRKTILELLQTIKSLKKETYAIVVKARVPVGDLFHYQSEMAGRYKFFGKFGHFNLRAYRKSANFHWEAVPPYKDYVEKYVDGKGVQVQDQSENLAILKNEYWHLTHLVRSSIDSHNKRKLEIGRTEDVSLPQVFFELRPKQIPSPWIHYTATEKFLAQIRTPLLYLKRRYL